MNGPQNRRRRFFLLLAPLLLGSVVVPAARSYAEEEKKVSPNTVVEGLKTIQRASEEIAKQAGENKIEAEKTTGVITPVWSMIEGAIRANDEKSYVAFEDAIEDLTAAATARDAKKVGEAAGALSSAVQSYVAKPAAGGASAAAPTRSADAAPKQAAAAPKEAAGAADRTAAAAEAGDATLARTGPASALTAVAGAAFGLGGLALIGGARRRR